MPNINDVFPDNDTEWLKVDDLQSRARRVTVVSTEVIQVKDFNDPTAKKPKIMIELKETPKRYIANVSSARAIAAAYGPETDSWVGKKIVLKPHMYPNGHMGILGEPVYEAEEGFDSAPKVIKDVAAAFNVKKEELDEDIPFS